MSMCLRKVLSVAAVALAASMFSPAASAQGPGPESDVHVSALACKRISGSVTFSYGRLGAGSGGAVVRCPIHLDRYAHNMHSPDDFDVVASGGHTCRSGPGSGVPDAIQQYIECSLSSGAWIHGYVYRAHHIGAGSTPARFDGLQDGSTICYARGSSMMRCPLIRREESDFDTAVTVSFNRTLNVGSATCVLFTPGNQGAPERRVTRILQPSDRSVTMRMPVINDTLLVECTMSADVSIRSVSQSEE